MPRKILTGAAAAALLAETCHGGTPSAEAARDSRSTSKLFHPEDGFFDLSRFLDEPAGFVPLIIPVTEPALGGGAAALPVFIQKPKGGGRPSVGGIGAMMTANDSKAAFGGYSGYFLDQKLHLTAAATTASINLDFFGIGEELNGLRYNLEGEGGMLGAEWKLGESNWNIGMRYAYGNIDASFKSEGSSFDQGLFGNSISYTTSSLRPSITYDSRDNIFTPTRGLVSDLSVTVNIESLGGDSNFEVLNWTNIFYHPLVEDHLFLGVKAEIEQSFGEQPFYMRPYVKLRGAPAARFQGEGVASLEAELRWQFHPRWSLVGFGGAGATWIDETNFSRTETTFTGGGGFRYLIARDYGLHAGCDLAYGEEGLALYIQFGSAWTRF